MNETKALWIEFNEDGVLHPVCQNPYCPNADVLHSDEVGVWSREELANGADSTVPPGDS